MITVDIKNSIIKISKNTNIDKNNNYNNNNNSKIINKTKINYNKNYINLKEKDLKAGNINDNKIILDNTRRTEQKSPINNKNIESNIKTYKCKPKKIDTYFFNYLPSSFKLNKKNKKSKKINIIALNNLCIKTFKEDFPIKIKDSKKNNINNNLKPQISARITLFNAEKPENERYYLVNFFYSENIKNSIKTENEI